MRKHHICDIMTWGRLIIAPTAMLCCALSPGIPLWVGLVVYVLGAGSDIDGFFARKYPYPDDGKPRWWRRNGLPSLLDELADVLLGLSVLAFFVSRIDIVIGLCITTATLSISIPLQCVKARYDPYNLPLWLDEMLLDRRILYFIALLAVLLIMAVEAFSPPANHLYMIAFIVFGLLAFAAYKVGLVNFDRLRRGSKIQ